MDITQSIVQIIVMLPIFLLAISVHEVAHGYVSYLLGDPTAKNAGRLTLNPIAHLDPVGALVLVITRMYGWAKPVPIDPRYYKNPRQGMMYVGLAGPGANFVMAILFSLIWMLMLQFRLVSLYMNPQSIRGIIATMIITGIQINIALGVFNLIPVPPLDGSKILRGFLPRKYDRYFYMLEGPQGMILIFILLFTGILGGIIRPIINLFMSVLM
ncbi:MAG: site-2 protease family protein [Halanaerobiaceae bacterium]